MKPTCEECGRPGRASQRGGFTCQPCRRAGAIPTPGDDEALTGGQWELRPGGVRVWVPDPEPEVVVPAGVCVTCGGRTHTYRRECGGCVAYRKALETRRDAEKILSQLLDA